MQFARLRSLDLSLRTARASGGVNSRQGAGLPVVWVLVVAATVAVLSSGPAQAYCLRSLGAFPPAVWEQQPVGYSVSNNITDAKVVAAIDAAFAVWAAAPCSNLTFAKQGTFDPAAMPFPGDVGTIRVYWYDQAAGFPQPGGIAHYNALMHDGAGGILRGAIAINAFNVAWGTDGANDKLDVQNEMVYLIGQVVGLTDSDATVSAMAHRDVIMPGDISSRSLQDDDRNAVWYLYPDTQNAACTADPPGPGSTCGGAISPQDAGTSGPNDGGSHAVDSGSHAVDSGSHAVDSGSHAVDAGIPSAADAAAATDGGVADAAGFGNGVPDTGAVSCSATHPCPDGFVCTITGQCVKVDTGGCSCTVGKDRGAAAPAMLICLVILGLMFGSGRGRRASRRGSATKRP